MATKESNEQSGPTVSVDAMALAFSQALKSVQPKPRITISNRVPHNPMNPENKKREFERAFYQNFSKVDPEDLTQEEFELIPKLREGVYLEDGKDGYLFEVIDVKRGTHRGIHLRYKNATPDQRMQLMVRTGGTLAGILKMLIADHDKQKVAERARRRAEEE